MNKLFISILFLFVFFIPVRADELVISLEEAVGLALKENLGLKQVRQDSKIAHWNKKIAFSGYLPQITAGLSIDKEYGHSGVSSGKKNYQLDLRLRQSLVDLSQIADIRAASLGVDYQDESRRGYKQGLVFEVIKRFYRGLLDQDKLKIRERAFLLAEQELDITQKRYQEGMVPYHDLLRSEAKALAAEAQKRQAEAEYNKSLNEFKNILGYKPERKVSLKGDFSFVLDEIELEFLTERAGSLHPQLAAWDYHIKQKQQGVASSRAEFLPRLDLEAAQSAAKYDRPLLGERDSFGWDDHWVAYFRVSLPLFEGARRYSQLSKSHQELKKAEIQRKELFNEIKKDINSFYQDYVSAQKLIINQKNNLEKSEELYQIMRKRYKLGEASEIELLDAHLNLISVESSYKEAKYQAIVSYHGMLFAAGQLDVERLEDRK